MKKNIERLFMLYKICRESKSNFFLVIFRFLLYKVLYGNSLILHPRVSVIGKKNIKTQGILQIGTAFVGFMHKFDRTSLNIRGKLITKGNAYLGRGCRIDINNNAVVTLGEGTYINCNTKLIISHAFTLGNNSGLSWDCQVLDSDFHDITYDDRKKKDYSVTIGENVWIGCGVKLYKGTYIADNCIVAADSIVKGRFDKPNCLIAGHPAKVIKENVEWSGLKMPALI